MKTFMPSITKAFQDFFSHKMLLPVLAVPVLTLTFWIAVLAWFWAPWTAGLANWLAESWAVRPLELWLPNAVAGITAGIAIVLLLLLLFPITYFTSLFLVSQLVVPFVQRHLLRREFADLERKPGGSLAGGLWNALKAGIVYAILLVLTLPLLFLPGAQIVVPAFLTAWVSRRVLTYDLLQGVATNEERRELLERSSGDLWAIGFLLGLLVIIPGLSFFLPVLITLAYGHSCYSRLREMRRLRPS